jgi:anti-sigma factor RsiW
MNDLDHDRGRLGVYVLGALEDDERRDVDTHVVSCEECRRELAELAEVARLLEEVPPEALLDGPPEGGDLLLARTVRRVRAESDRGGRRRLAVMAAGVVAFTAVTLGAGVVIGQGTATQSALPPAPTAITAPGTREISAHDATTGATMTATIIPAQGWVRLRANVEGVKAGQRCQLVVVARGGERLVAGSWLVSSSAEAVGISVEGSALVEAGQIASLDIVTTPGGLLVSVPAEPYGCLVLAGQPAGVTPRLPHHVSLDPDRYGDCRCGAMHKDPDAGRFGSYLGDDNIEIYRQSA